MRFVGVFFLFLCLVAIAQPCQAADVLILTFDDSSKPFMDGSPAARAVTSGTVPGFSGKGVRRSDQAPLSPAGGGYAVLDGGSFLTVPPSADLVIDGPSDFTIRFWFKSPGIDRGAAAGRFRGRMHALSLGQQPADNLYVNFNDTDSNGRGLWTYWHGSGTSAIWTAAGTVGQFTDDRWYHYWLVREKGVLTLYVGDDQRRYRRIGTANVAGRMGSVVMPVFIGSYSDSSTTGNGALCWLGALDDIRITREALHPTRIC